MSRDIKEGASGPEAFTLLLRRLMTHFDCSDKGEGYTGLNNFGVYTGTSLCDFSREFRVLVSAVTGSEQFPTLMPNLYPASMATDPKLYASLDKMWKAFSDLAHNTSAGD